MTCIHSVRTASWVAVALWLFTAAVALGADKPAEPKEKGIAGIGPLKPFRVVHTGLKFTEGTADDGKGNLYFSDVNANHVLLAQAGAMPEVIVDHSGGINGLMFGGPGRLIGCQMGLKKVVAIDVVTKKMDVLADNCEGTPFAGPNDLVLDRDGNIYFTDPSFLGGAASAVYFVGTDGKVQRLFEDPSLPNGIIMSPDEKTLYVLRWNHADVMAYPIDAPGKLGEPKVLCQLEQPKGKKTRGGDGMAVDQRGNLYLTAPGIGALQVVSPEGKTLGKIPIGAAPTNCTFGGKDLKTLYVTAGGRLLAFEMEVVGHRCGPK